MNYILHRNVAIQVLWKPTVLRIVNSSKEDVKLQTT